MFAKIIPKFGDMFWTKSEENFELSVRLEVLTAVVIKSSIFWHKHCVVL
jgi:hypothetical protein